MKIRIECDEAVEETQVLIRCRELDEQITHIQQLLTEAAKQERQFVFYKGDTEFYLPLRDLLFLETDGRGIQVHTRDDIYQTDYKLYELEELLPGNFMRVSKSALLLSIGFSILFGKQAAGRRAGRSRQHHEEWAKSCHRNEHYQRAQGEVVYDNAFGEDSGQADGEMLYFKNSFGQSDKYVTSDQFKSAVINNSFGEMKVYFSHAAMQQATATIDVSNSFGETQIFIPMSWRAELQIHSALGAVTEKNHPQPDGHHTVILTGSNSMGEIQIIYI